MTYKDISTYINKTVLDKTKWDFACNACDLGQGFVESSWNWIRYSE